MLNKTFLGDHNATIHLHKQKTHCERVKVYDEDKDNTQKQVNRYLNVHSVMNMNCYVFILVDRSL